MELNQDNPNGEIVLTSTLNHITQSFFEKLWKIALKNESYKLFFKEVASIA